MSNRINGDAEFLYNDELIYPESSVNPESDTDKSDRLLLDLVKYCPWLYDHSLVKDNGLIKKRKRTWKKIAKQMKSDVPSCRKQWIRLRVALQRAIKLNRGSRWKYYDRMKFVLPHLRQYKKTCWPIDSEHMDDDFGSIEIDDDGVDIEQSQDVDACKDNCDPKENDLGNIKIENVRCIDRFKAVEDSIVQNDADCTSIEIENVGCLLDDSFVKIENAHCDLEEDTSSYTNTNTNIASPNTCENRGDIMKIDTDDDKLEEEPQTDKISRVDSIGDDVANSEVNEDRCRIVDGDIIEVDNDEGHVEDCQEPISAHENRRSSDEGTVETDENTNVKSVEDRQADNIIDLDDDNDLSSEQYNEEESSDPYEIHVDSNKKKNDEKIMGLVKNYPAIFCWDARSRSQAYTERIEAWKEIAKLTGLEVKQCKSRWEYLKNRLKRIITLQLPLNCKVPCKRPQCMRRLLDRIWLYNHMEYCIPYFKVKYDVPGRSQKPSCIHVKEITSGDEEVTPEPPPQEETTWSDEEAEDYVLKSYITNVLTKKESRQRNRHDIDVEDELSCYTSNFFK